MEALWRFLQNPFLNSARRSFKKLNVIVSYTYDRLKSKAGDAFFDELIADLEPAYLNWREHYVDWHSSHGAHKGATVALKNKIAELAGDKIELWDIKIQNVYTKDSPEYIKLLAHDRKPFQSGKRVSRIQAVSTLIESIGSDAGLASVKALVVAFNTELNAVQSSQATKLVATNNFRIRLKAEMPEVGKQMYLVLVKMLAHYYETPILVRPYFDMETIRQGIQVEFARTVKPAHNISVAKRKLKSTHKVRVINNGKVPIILFYAPEKNDPYTTFGVTIAPGEEEIFPASDLGNLTDGHFIKAYNADENNDAHFILTIIK